MPLSFFPAIIEWPALLQRERGLMWELVANTMDGGRSFSGVQPVGRADGGGLWMATMRDVQVSTPAQLRCWHALAAILDGGATPVILSMRDEVLAPWVGGVVADAVETTHSDDSTFSDGTSYASSAILAQVFEDAALRATTLKLTMISAAALQGGEEFSIQHDTFSHRRYRIGGVRVWPTYTEVTIRPPLREAVVADTVLEFDNPKCAMKLATPNAMDLMRELRNNGQATVKFFESFPPWPGIS